MQRVVDCVPPGTQSAAALADRLRAEAESALAVCDFIINKNSMLNGHVLKGSRRNTAQEPSVTHCFPVAVHNGFNIPFSSSSSSNLQAGCYGMCNALVCMAPNILPH